MCGRVSGRPWRSLALGLAVIVTIACSVGLASEWLAGPSSSAPAPTRPDLVYAHASPQQLLDLWLPDQLHGPSPLVIFVHGGGFSSGDKRDVGPKLTPLLRSGYAVASVDYRLAPQAVFPAAARDVEAAVRFLRFHAPEWGIDPDRFALWGESAGANLAALVAAVGDRRSVLDEPGREFGGTPVTVQAVVDWYGPIDLAAREAQFRAGGSDCRSPQLVEADRYTTGYLGADVDRVHQRAVEANPLTYLGAASKPPPFSIAHGTADCLVPVVQANDLARALRAAGDQVDLRILRGAVHADPRFDKELLAPTIDWLDSVLRQVATPG